jgi:hypothetical protein
MLALLHCLFTERYFFFYTSPTPPPHSSPFSPPPRFPHSGATLNAPARQAVVARFEDELVCTFLIARGRGFSNVAAGAFWSCGRVSMAVWPLPYPTRPQRAAHPAPYPPFMDPNLIGSFLPPPVPSPPVPPPHVAHVDRRPMFALA